MQTSEPVELVDLLDVAEEQRSVVSGQTDFCSPTDVVHVTLVVNTNPLHRLANKKCNIIVSFKDNIVSTLCTPRVIKGASLSSMSLRSKLGEMTEFYN